MMYDWQRPPVIIIVLLFLARIGLSQSPGNVSGSLSLWLKADAGVTGTTQVSTWADQAGSNDATQGTASKQPEYISSSANYNPAIFFDYTTIESMVMNGLTIDMDVTDVTIIVVCNSDGPSAQSSQHILSQFDGTGTGRSILYYGESSDKMSSFLGGTTSASTTDLELGQEMLYTMTLASSGSSNLNFYKYGASDGSNTINPETANGAWRLGERKVDGDWTWNGTISELVVYSQVLVATDRQRVESYLALKYGITLDQTSATDYVASDGTTEMWDKDATNASIYNNNIAGIGRDDNSALGQVQSKSEASGAVVEITAEGEGTNAANSFVDIADMEFLTWGHNGSAMNAGYQDDFDGVNIESRLNRVWKAQETGDVGNVTIAIDLSGVPESITGSDLRLMIDADGVFASGATLYTGTYSAPTFTVTGVNLTGGDYFTVGSIDVLQTSLPVEFLDVVMAKVEDGVQIIWSTASEENNDFFTIQKSDNMVEWYDLGTVDGVGNATSINHYSFIDMSLTNDLSYYRVKQTDFDGQFDYSKVVSVNSETFRLSHHLYPNPVVEKFSVDHIQENAAFKIISATGREVVLSSKWLPDQGGTRLFDSSSLPSGLYLILTDNATLRFYKR